MSEYYSKYLTDRKFIFMQKLIDQAKERVHDEITQISLQPWSSEFMLMMRQAAESGIYAATINQLEREIKSFIELYNIIDEDDQNDE